MALGGRYLAMGCRGELTHAGCVLMRRVRDVGSRFSRDDDLPPYVRMVKTAAGATGVHIEYSSRRGPAARVMIA